MNLEKMYEDRFGKFPLKNITYVLIFGQLIAYILMMLYPGFSYALFLQGTLVIKGEWWRVFTMLFQPLSPDPVWVVLDWYMMHIFGSALELNWGVFRYVTYLFFAYIATLIAAFIFPTQHISNGYIFGSVFLAFVYLFPNFTVLLFFVIPIKIKWFGYLAWISMIWSVVFGDTATRILALIATGNFFIFFGKEIVLKTKDRAKHGSFVASSTVDNHQAYMRCVVCKKTEKDDKIFYYCHTCVPDTCYCEDHIKQHVHRLAV